MNYIMDGFDKFKVFIKYMYSIPVKHYKITFFLMGIGIIALIISALVTAGFIKGMS